MTAEKGVMQGERPRQQHLGRRAADVGGVDRERGWRGWELRGSVQQGELTDAHRIRSRWLADKVATKSKV
jgi:hypothetical protein